MSIRIKTATVLALGALLASTPLIVSQASADSGGKSGGVYETGGKAGGANETGGKSGGAGETGGKSGRGR